MYSLSSSKKLVIFFCSANSCSHNHLWYLASKSSAWYSKVADDALCSIRGEFASANSSFGWNFRLFWIFDSAKGVEGPLFSAFLVFTSAMFVYVCLNIQKQVDYVIYNHVITIHVINVVADPLAVGVTRIEIGP